MMIIFVFFLPRGFKCEGGLAGSEKPVRIRPNTIATGNHVWNNFETLVVLTIGSISHLLNETRVITKRCVCKFKKSCHIAPKVKIFHL